MCSLVGMKGEKLWNLLQAKLATTSFTSVGNEADRTLKWIMAGLPDHLGRLEEEGRWDRQAQRLGRLEVDD
jgi:hypothetical protein